MNRSSKKPSNTFRYRLSKDINKNKPTKITIDTSKIPEKKEEEKKIQPKEIDPEKEKQPRKDKIIHENNLTVIQMIQEELDKLEKENDLLNNEYEQIKQEEKDLIERFDQINKEIDEETGNLEELKDINEEKNGQYLRLSHMRHQLIMQQEGNNYNNNSNNNTQERRERERPGEVLNHFTLGEVMDGILNITNINGESNQPSQFPFIFIPRAEVNEEGPPMSYQQLQALPSYNYQGRNSKDKCNICDFDLCYNDLVTTLSKCNHTFHKNCLVNRLSTRRSSKCPNCKVSII